MKLPRETFDSLRRAARRVGFNPYDTAATLGTAFRHNLQRRLDHLDGRVTRSEYNANRLLQPQAE
jgi:hypothetical protein